jgi:hypothetical protein
LEFKNRSGSWKQRIAIKLSLAGGRGQFGKEEIFLKGYNVSIRLRDKF